MQDTIGTDGRARRIVAGTSSECANPLDSGKRFPQGPTRHQDHLHRGDDRGVSGTRNTRSDIPVLPDTGRFLRQKCHNRHAA